MKSIKKICLLLRCLGLLIFFWPGHLVAKNIGHRLGGDYFPSLPENSLLVLETSLKGHEDESPIVLHRDFKYAEFDIQETYDGELVVFHDKTFSRMLPSVGQNVEVYDSIIANIYQRIGKKIKAKDIRMKYVTLEEAQSLQLRGAGEEFPPTLEEVLDLARDNQISKPLVVEIKYLQTDNARTKLVDIVREYQDNFGQFAEIVHLHDFPGSRSIQFLAFTKKFKSSFPSTRSRQIFCKMIKDAGLGGIYKAGKHGYNHCASYTGDVIKKKKKKKKKRKWWKFW